MSYRWLVFLFLSGLSISVLSDSYHSLIPSTTVRPFSYPQLIVKGKVDFYLKQDAASPEKYIGSLAEPYSDRHIHYGELVNGSVYFYGLPESKRLDKYKIFDLWEIHQAKKIILRPNIEDFKVSPKQNFIATEEMDEPMKICLLTKGGEKIYCIDKHGEDEEEIGYEGFLIGWSKDGRYLYYSNGFNVYKLNVSSRESLKFPGNEHLQFNDSELFNVSAHLVAHVDEPNNHALMEEEVKAWKSRVRPIYVSDFETGESVAIAKVKFDPVFSWVDHQTLLILNAKGDIHSSYRVGQKPLSVTAKKIEP